MSVLTLDRESFEEAVMDRGKAKKKEKPKAAANMMAAFRGYERDAGSRPSGGFPVSPWESFEPERVGRTDVRRLETFASNDEAGDDLKGSCLSQR